jgi:hypothetical protein
MLWKRKKIELYDQAKSDYEEALTRCYGYENLTLALCSFSRFMGFNPEDFPTPQDTQWTSEQGEFGGVVHEPPGCNRHIRCDLQLGRQRRAGDLGHFVLTHVNSVNTTNKPIRREEQELYLQAALYDDPPVFHDALLHNLRDAAISGFRFIHLELLCTKPSDRDVASAAAMVRERGYGPHRRILHLKMWPQVELGNAPAWARRLPY